MLHNIGADVQDVFTDRGFVHKGKTYLQGTTLIGTLGSQEIF